MTPPTTNASLTDPSPRQNEILQIIRDQGFATLEALAETFNVSTQTIRRDVIDLSKQGFLQRFHGGAGLPNNMVRLGHEQKNRLSPEAKQHIGEYTACLIPNGASVFLDVGTTVEAVARSLGNHRNLRLVTNSMLSAAIISAQSHQEIHVIGGIIYGNDGSMVSNDAPAAIRRFAFDYCVIGCSGFDKDGAPLDHDRQKVAIKNAAIRSSRHNILVADHSKFNSHPFMRIAEATDFKSFVTDLPPPAQIQDGLTRAGTKIIVTNA
ncbi:DeoR/GlpR family DNA-binding transcription regulator [Thalassospira marina]|uniref:Transcriptional regulator n=1 Tax=Thalassospira marina TaxID=2048283 RepID=A0A2N3KYM5_9PROT|nr:DeoR/GlpR family DNA-binding transcription regulator [Thalassospira marina]PKR55597.1 transcriptional regulator [Thalassospira marina]